MDLGLTGKVAIITGGSEGIGKAAAHRMAAEGARAVIVARRPEVLEAAARDIEKSTGGVVLPIRGDVAEQETVNRVLETALDRFGRVDILVNNAGVSMAKSFEEVSDEDWESDFSLKVWGAVRFIRAKRCACHIPSVSGVCGVVTITKSARGSRVSRSATG